MSISAESTSTRIILNIADNNEPFFLQRADYKNRKWLTYADGGFFDIESDESIKPLAISAGDFVDSFGLYDALFEYRYIPESDGIEADGDKWTYSTWVKFGTPDCVGYTFGNYHPAGDEWGLS